jgi:hypothetical protein
MHFFICNFIQKKQNSQQKENVIFEEFYIPVMLECKLQEPGMSPLVLYTNLD